MRHSKEVERNFCDFNADRQAELFLAKLHETRLNAARMHLVSLNRADLNRTRVWLITWHNELPA